MLQKAYLRWHFANEIPHSFERYLAPSAIVRNDATFKRNCIKTMNN